MSASNPQVARDSGGIPIVTSWCYTLAAVVTAAGLCAGAWGLFAQSEAYVVGMIVSIGVYGFLRLLAGIGESLILTRSEASSSTPGVLASWCYTGAAVITAAGLCFGAWGLFNQSTELIFWMVVSIGLYGLLRLAAGVFEHMMLRQQPERSV
jgi:hypothetical protein